MTRMKNKPELLAPAGNMEKCKIALRYGADAVYLGGKMFGLRAFANNFSIEEIAEAAAYAHGLGKKVYVTVNIFAHTKIWPDCRTICWNCSRPELTLCLFLIWVFGTWHVRLYRKCRCM